MSYFALPLFNAAENLSKLIEQSPNTVSTAYREVSLEESRQQTCIFCCTVGGCSKYDQLFHGEFWHSETILCSDALAWPQTFFLPSVPENSVGWGMQCPPSPHPSPYASPLLFEPPVKKKYSFYCFLLLLALAWEYQQTQGSLCPLTWLVAGSQRCIIENTNSVFLAWLSDPRFTLPFASSSYGKNSKFNPVHCSSFSFIPRHFSWNFHLWVLASTLQHI